MGSWEPSTELLALALLTCALVTCKQWLKACGAGVGGGGVGCRSLCPGETGEKGNWASTSRLTKEEVGGGRRARESDREGVARQLEGKEGS